MLDRVAIEAKILPTLYGLPCLLYGQPRDAFDIFLSPQLQARALGCAEVFDR
jgi:hypothetical protein